ncbi:hypothetical protein VTI74DRAFT_5383 [Chaetomium olivicolor]
MATTTEANTVTLRAQCLCRAQTFTACVPHSALPLKGSSCHCTSCRHVTGAMRSSDAVWPGPTGDIVSAAGGQDSTLKRYRFSGRANILFCGGCGSKLFWEQWQHPQPSREDEDVSGEGVEYFVFTGVLDGEGEGWDKGRPLVKWEDHIFVGDTRDGGASCWLRGMNGEVGEPVKVWLGGRDKSEEVAPGVCWPAVKDLPGYEVTLKAAEGDKGNVPIRCHCGGVDFVLRAGEAQRESAERQKNGGELSRFADPVTHKLYASLDCCDSCRIWSGSEVVHWTFPLLRHMSFAGENAEHLPEDTSKLREALEANDSRLGTLAMYASSPRVQRYFCGSCSACVFYAVDTRPDMVDLAVGMLDSPEGARAESALSWAFGGLISWKPDMIGTWREGLLQAVERESEQWRIERGYPKNWMRVAVEQATQAGGN